MNRVGIERVNIYGSSMFLEQRDLAHARGRDPERVVNDFLINRRTIVPPWEDTVTMAANAAAPLMDYVDPGEIGLLVVGTEGGIDFGKPVSSNVHSALGLPTNVRNFETKFACYGGVAALDTAVNWIASGFNKGKKAIVISSDFSRMHLNMMEEFVLGGLAAACIVSEQPDVLQIEPGRGTWTQDSYDTFRPSAHHEMGNNEVSLYTYMDALEGAWTEFHNERGLDFDRDFTHLLYHTPFPGMAFQAHRTLCNLNARRKKAEVREDFNARVLPGLEIAQSVGSTYGASNFAGLGALFGSGSGSAPQEGSRIGFFAYGSGAIGEFYSGVAGPRGAARAAEMNIGEHLQGRHRVDVDTYEKLEQTRSESVEKADFVPDVSYPDGLFDSHYRDTGRLVLKSVDNFYRTYVQV